MTKSQSKQIDKKFKRCSTCKQLYFNLKSHMHRHVGKEITQEDYDNMFKEVKIKPHRRRIKR